MTELRDARTLTLRITEKGRDRNLSFPASCVRLLSKIIPSEVQESFHRAGVDPQRIDQLYGEGPIRCGSVVALTDPSLERTILLYLH